MYINKNLGKSPILFALLLLIFVPAAAQSVKVGYIIDGDFGDQPEIEAGLRYAESLEGYEVSGIPLEKVNNHSLKKFDQLWFHRPDTTAISSLEMRVGKAVKNFINKGGNLLLTLDAVRLLNAWEIEDTPITSTSAEVQDHGFGRKLGFHSFRQHPVFRELHGGAYVWHSKQDHKVRKVGFFQDNHPQGPKAKIIGIDWAYITYHENTKLVWEYTLGKGKIMAVGAYIYFSEPNFNQDQLHKFVENSLVYLEDRPVQEDVFYWTYKMEDPRRVDLDRGAKLASSKNRGASWKFSQPKLKLSRFESTDNYWDLPGTRLLLMGKEKGGFDELWAHPFMAFRDFVPGVKVQNSEDIIWLNNLIPSVDFTPGVMVRTYKIGENTLKEISTVSVEDTGMLIHYEWTGNESVSMFITATTNLRLMWPYSSYSTGTLGYEWSDNLNSLLVTDLKTRTMNGMIGFNQVPKKLEIGKYEKFNDNRNGLKAVQSDKNQISAGFEFSLSPDEQLDVIIAAGDLAMEDLINDYKEIASNPKSLLESTVVYYEDLGKNVMKIETPDPLFNEGFKWAMAGANQFLVETPGVGKSLVAGYGTTASGWRGGHDISGRPGYAWYFGRDAQWSGFALNAYGDFENVKEILKTFNTFQNINGKIYHELTTSGSVHYDASDATPLYILLVSHYIKASGDTEFLRETWDHIEKAIEYCYSTDTDGDGFIENTNVGHGWVEGGALFGAHTTFYLAGVWSAALRESAYLAEIVGEDQKAARYQKDYRKIREQLNTEFWDSEKEHFHYGLLNDGSYNEEITMLPAVPIYFNTVDRKKAEMATEKYASGNISTDWGVRILEEKSEHFNPGGYHVGSVWPLFTGWTALAEYETGRYNQGFTHFMNNLVIYKHWDLGSISEVLNGVNYKPSGVTHNQGWSQTMVLQPILEGMLGIKPDAINNHLTLSPRLPWHWNEFLVKNIRFGNHFINMEIQKTDEKSEFTFSHEGKGIATIDFHPLFQWGTEFQSVTADGEKVDYSVEEKGGGLTLVINDLRLDSGAKVEVAHSFGFGALPLVEDPVLGDSSKGMKIIREESKEDWYHITLEGRPGLDYVLEVFAFKKPENISGATYMGGENNLHQLKVSFPSSENNYEIVKVDMKF